MDYREPFELQTHQIVQNDKGDTSAEWTTVFKGFARVANLGSREFWEAAATGAENTLKFFTRYHPSFPDVGTRDCRLLWRGKALDVTQIDNLNHQNDQIIMRAVMKDE
ncbi:phage head closure protein [Raoultibacter timonensis]|uniref:phage head closure protein n=1 Tax=Raoultibacter timonensis TaxID=1907662 RepID=UPI001FCB7EEC|nr:phage head closure protein [Raoultibacter timonensis]